MKKRGFILLILSLPFLAGCFGTSRYFDAVRSDILGSLKGKFSKDVEFSIGPVALSVAGIFADAAEDPVPGEIIKDLSKVQIGVYKRHSDLKDVPNYVILRKIDRRMKKFGWHYFVRSCSSNEIAVLYVNKDLENGIRNMFIVTLDNQELVLLHLQGNLPRIFQAAVHERGLNSLAVH